MRNFCGKIVNSMGITSRITSGWLSPESVHAMPMGGAHRVKLLFVHKLFPLSTQGLSTQVTPLLPLIEHYFYPVSTAPITRAIKEKFKER